MGIAEKRRTITQTRQNLDAIDPETGSDVETRNVLALANIFTLRC